MTINSGNVQRSRVTSLKIDFDQVVTLPVAAATAFELKRQSDGAIVDLTATVTNDTATHVLLTFTGALSEFGSLKDGRYTLTVLASMVSNANGALDGNCDGFGDDDFVLVGDPATNKLHRFFGDINGDGDTDGQDFLQLVPAFLGAYNAAFDFEGDGDVDGADFLQFVPRFLMGAI